VVGVAGERLQRRGGTTAEQGADAHRGGEPGACRVGVDELQLGQGQRLAGPGETHHRLPGRRPAPAGATGEVVEGHQARRRRGRPGRVGEEIKGEGKQRVPGE